MEHVTETTETPPLVPRARNSGHKPLNDQIRTDWINLVERHPDSFGALLYLPGEEPETGEEAEPALFGTVDRQREAISYAAPVIVTALEAQSDDPAFVGMWDDAEHLGAGESDTLTLLLSCVAAPLGSIIEFVEEIASGELRRAWWYVQRVDVVGSAAVGALHVCIPCGDLEQNPAQAIQLAQEAAHD